MTELDPQRLALVAEDTGELAERMGLVVTSLTAEAVAGDLPVEGNRQPYGLLHGGANAVLAETLGSMHAALLSPQGCFPVGIELSCTHHRSARSGTVHGVSTPLNVGRTLATFDIVITDDDGRRCCTARLTCLFRPSTPARSG